MVSMLHPGKYHTFYRAFNWNLDWYSIPRESFEFSFLFKYLITIKFSFTNFKKFQHLSYISFNVLNCFFLFLQKFLLQKKRLRKKMFCQSLSEASILDFQRNRRRTVRGYRGARILQRSGRVSLYPTNPGKRTPLPPQWSCAQGPEST